MTYILSAVWTPRGKAKYGKALVPPQDPFKTAGSATQLLFWIFSQYASNTATQGEAKEIGRGLIDAPGREIRHVPSGLTFRIDPVDAAPHPCPCDDDTGNPCERLVLPDDHANADAEDALCLGCFTWRRGMVACLPENSAHAK